MRKILTLLSLTLAASASGQTVFSVSKNYDSKEGNAAYAFPGFARAFRQQILISGKRLVGLKGKKLKGVWIRRDTSSKRAFTGGQVDLNIALSPSQSEPWKASETFSSNAKSPASVFTGRVRVPNSPKVTTPHNYWSTSNSVRITFAKTYTYGGGDLCIDVAGRPVAGSEPDFWMIDHEGGTYDGASKSIGTSCSLEALEDRSLFTNAYELQIGSSMSIYAVGRPGALPMMALGLRQIIGGADLGAMGATGCRLYVDFFLSAPLIYRAPPKRSTIPIARFSAQIPSSTGLLGSTLFVQFADDESRIAVKDRTNTAGLTTSNALEIKIATLRPDLEMSVITSRVVKGNAAMPTRGAVDVSTAPVLRLIY